MSILPENVFISNFCEVKMNEFCAQKSYIMLFWSILGPYDPLKSPLHYQQRTLQDSYSPKIFHKRVLPENGFISSFFEVKMTEKCQNVIFHAFDQFWDHMTHSKAPDTTNEVL